MIPVPGGEPHPVGGPHARHLDNMRAALRDRNFLSYLCGLGGVNAGTLLYLSFLPLFLKQKLGLTPSTVVTMETVVMVGGALSALLWGRAADRVGSRPVLMAGVALTLLVPLGWLLLPRQAPHLLVWCGALYLLHGMAFNGCAIGAGRLLLNGVVPPEHNTAYMAVFYSWQGLLGGAAPLLAGALLQLCSPWRQALGGLTVDGHAVLFLLATLAVALGWTRYLRVRPDDRYRTRDVVQRVTERVLDRLPWLGLKVV
jgi:MFS family permease